MIALIIWHSLDHAPVAVFVAIVGMLSIAAYRRRWLPALLRTIALSAIAAALLRPGLLLQATPTDRGAVVVLMDESASCHVADPQRSPAQLLGIAQSLGKVPPDAQKNLPSAEPLDLTALERVIQQVLRAHEEVDYASVAGQDEEPARQRLQRAGQQFDSAVKDYFRQAEKTQPTSISQEIAGLGQLNAEYGSDDWLRELRARLRKITTLQSTLKLSAEERLLQSDPQVKLTCQQIAQMPRIDLAEQVVRQDLLNKLPVSVPVYLFGFSDRLRELHALSTTQPATLSNENETDIIAALSAARSNLSKEKIQAIVLMSDGRQTGHSSVLETTLQNTGIPVVAVPLAPVNPPPDVSVVRVDAPQSAFAGEVVSVEVELRSTINVPSLSVQMSSGKQLQKQTIKVEANKPTIMRFQLETRDPGQRAIEIQADSVSGEVTTSNNTVVRMMDVVPSKLRVLVIADSADEEIKYIRQSLAALPGAEVSEDRKTIGQQDVIIVGNAKLSPAEDAELKKSIARGKSVIFLSNATILEEAPVAGTIKADRWPGDEAVMEAMVVPTELNPLSPGVRRISHFDSGLSLKGEAKVLLIEKESRHPLVVEEREGNGRSFFVATDETRLWKNDDWQRLVRYAWQGIELKRRGSTEPAHDELTDVSGDETFLRRIADATGGDVIPLDQASKLASRVLAIGDAREKSIEFPLWDSSWLLAIVLAALTAEWAIRKHLGMA